MTTAGANPFASLAEIDELLRGPRSGIERVRDQRLEQALRTAWEEVPFYRELVGRQGGRVERPRRWEDWPTWNVEDLRQSIQAHPPYGNIYTVDGLRDIRMINSSTGTSGAPRLFPECAVDRPGMEAMYRRYADLMGITTDDVCCVTMSFSLSRGAWSMARAIESAGATLVPASSGRVTPTEKLLAVLESTRTTVLGITPSFAAHVTTVAKENGLDVADLPVRLLWLSAEAAPPSLRQHLEEAWGASTVVTYGNTDVSWAGVECEASRRQHGALGMHLFEDIATIEIVDESGGPVADGEYGELVVTSWARASTPRIRFRTGDRAAMTTARCECGLNALRMLPIEGRVDDSIRFRGQTIWPSAVADVLSTAMGGPVEFSLELKSGDRPDQQELVLWIEEERARQFGEERLAELLRSKLNVRFTVRLTDKELLASRTGAGQEMKARRVVRT